MHVFVGDAETSARHHALELDAARLIPSWESPNRAATIAAAITENHQPLAGGDLDDELLGRVHDAGYLEFLRTAWDDWQQLPGRGPAAMAACWPARWMATDRPPVSIDAKLGYYGFGADCSITAGTWAAARSAAALAQSAADDVLAGATVNFALCRPPGHHATIDQFGGYCYLNNAAIAAQRCLDGGSGRVAIVDVDYHHGNGTQQIFYERSDVYYASIHADPVTDFPYFAGFADERGRGDGVGYTRNEPLPAGTGFATWSAALERCLDDVVTLGCDMLVMSLGVDTFVDDPISQFRLTTGDFATLGARLAAVGLPTVIVMEGGYDVDDLGVNVAAVLDTFDIARVA